MATKPAAKPARKTAAPQFDDGPLPRALDARPDRLDFRDLIYRPALASLPARFPDEADMRRFLPSYVKAGLILNQGSEGACTGFGLACVANYLLWRRHLSSGAKGSIESVSPRMFYELAKHYDEWPGQDYDGSSCRGALKGWHKHGVCSQQLWPYPLNKDNKPRFVRPKGGWAEDATRRPLGVYYRVNKLSVVDMQSAINETGAVYVSATVHDGWDQLAVDKPRPAPKTHRELPIIPPVTDPSQNGGHSFALVGFNEHGFIVQNSWGLTWGASGFGVLPYGDWVTNATDAWALGLGVPLDLRDARGSVKTSRSSSFRSGRALGALAPNTRNPANPSDDPWPIDHPFHTPAYQPWSTAQAYEHSLVSGNDGQMMVTDFTRQRGDVEGQAHETVVSRPLAWAKARKCKTLKLALYAHGGLNDEAASIQRIRVLAPYFDANDIYPLFITWKTGPGETLQDMLQDWVRHIMGEAPEGRSGGFLDGLADAKDRAIEALGRTLGRGIWSEMRENAQRGADDGHVLSQAAKQLRALRDALAAAGMGFELHLIGHSAGSILLGHLLDLLGGKSPIQVQTCHLYAAACSIDFANAHYLPAAKAGVLALKDLHLSYLSDANERADGLPSGDKPLYGKSLLYLVSRSLDDVRKQPLLGMERSLLSASAADADQWDAGRLPGVRQWQATWGTVDQGDPRALPVKAPKVRTTRQGGQIAAAHGSFDNNIDVLTDTLTRIRGTPLIGELEWLDY